jgi:phosphatidylserine/phosphatidylglycerophosphate/cardiolipin synthase-like enzyme
MAELRSLLAVVIVEHRNSAMPNEWSPDYWFLNTNEAISIPSPSGAPIRIHNNELLNQRFKGWNYQNITGPRGAAFAWNMTEPEKHLLMPYTSNNEVIAFVDGDAYMKDLYDRLVSTTDPVQFVLMAGWEFSLSRWLDQANQGQSRLADVLANLVHSNPNVNVRLLAFDNPIPGIKNDEIVDSVNSIYPRSSPPTNAAYLDRNLGALFMSHHQKEVFVGGPDFSKSYAYVGGIDLAVDRWDTSAHAKPNAENRFFGWHDIQLRVRGDAITQIWANFAERWNSNADLIQRKQQDFRLKECPIPKWTPTKPGTQHVQVLRTVAPASSDLERFMANGERTVLCGLKKAIENAECYIYIEEQFLWDCELADLIAAQMALKQRLRLIIVMTAGTEFPLDVGMHAMHLRSKFFQTAMGVMRKSQIAFGPKTRVYVYGLFQTPNDGGKPVYVHSKLIIIDDRYVAIGSANVNSRSLHIETELTLGIVDETTVPGILDGRNTTVCAFAKNLRERLWTEHLGLTVLPPDPIAALGNFPQGVTSDWDNQRSFYTWPTNETDAERIWTTHRLRCYVNQPGRRAPTAAMARMLDRNELRWR